MIKRMISLDSSALNFHILSFYEFVLYFILFINYFEPISKLCSILFKFIDIFLI